MAERTATQPHGSPIRAGGSEEIPASKLYGLLAEFSTPAEIYHAAERVNKAGYKWWDCHTPFPVHGLDKAMGLKPTILPLLVFGAGLTGTILAIILQWFTNATDMTLPIPPVPVTGYAFLISGKPAWSFPANIPVIFELTVLFAAGSTFIFTLLLNGLPRLYHPLFKNRRFLRATSDRFFIVIEARDPLFYRGRTEEFLHSLGPNAVEAVEN